MYSQECSYATFVTVPPRQNPGATQIFAAVQSDVSTFRIILRMIPSVGHIVQLNLIQGRKHILLIYVKGKPWKLF